MTKSKNIYTCKQCSEELFWVHIYRPHGAYYCAKCDRTFEVQEVEAPTNKINRNVYGVS